MSRCSQGFLTVTVLQIRDLRGHCTSQKEITKDEFFATPPTRKPWTPYQVAGVKDARGLAQVQPEGTRPAKARCEISEMSAALGTRHLGKETASILFSVLSHKPNHTTSQNYNFTALWPGVASPTHHVKHNPAKPLLCPPSIWVPTAELTSTPPDPTLFRAGTLLYNQHRGFMSHHTSSEMKTKGLEHRCTLLSSASPNVRRDRCPGSYGRTGLLQCLSKGS